MFRSIIISVLFICGVYAQQESRWVPVAVTQEGWGYYIDTVSIHSYIDSAGTTIEYVYLRKMLQGDLYYTRICRRGNRVRCCEPQDSSWSRLPYGSAEEAVYFWVYGYLTHSIFPMATIIDIVDTGPSY